MKALSRDLRERIVACEATTGQTAERYQVAPATVRRLRAQMRRLGHVKALAPQPQPLMLEPYREELKGWIAEQPGMTLAEMAARLRARHRVQVALPTIHKALGRFGLSRKKRR
jgi:transposase